MKIKDRTIKILIFSLGIAIAYLLHDKVQLPYIEHTRIISVLAKLQYNPQNNILRFLLFLVLPSLLLVFYNLLKLKSLAKIEKEKLVQPQVKSKPLNIKKSIKILLFSLLLIFFFMMLANFYNYDQFDHFHEGEALGISTYTLHGKVPFQDFYPSHGMIRDSFIPILGFRLLGRYISSFRIIEAALYFLTFVSALIFFVLLFKGNYIIVEILAIFILLYHIVFSMLIKATMLFVHSDMLIFFFLIILISLKRQDSHQFNFKSLILSFLLGFITSFSYIYSFERGVYLSIILPIVIFMIFLFFDYKTTDKLKFLPGIFTGLITGMVLLGFSLSWNFTGFFDFVFNKYPGYGPLLYGKVLRVDNWLFLLVFTLFALNLFLLVDLLFIHFKRKKIREFFYAYFLEIILFITSVFTMGNFILRSDPEHLSYSCYFIFFSFFLILYKLLFLKTKFLFSKKTLYVLTPILLLITLFMFGNALDKGLLHKTFPYGIKDGELLTESYKETVDFIEGNLEEDELFVTLTNEPSWYYLVNKPCPIKFPDASFGATPSFQRGMIKDFKSNNVKLVLFKNNNPIYNFDEIENRERLPILYSYIEKEYTFFKEVYDNEIWIKKEKRD